MSGKSAKLCKHVIALIRLIREHYRYREGVFDVRGGRRNSSYLCGAHQLFPVTFADRRVLQFADGAQRRDHVLHGGLQARVRVPRPHLFVQRYRHTHQDVKSIFTVFDDGEKRRETGEKSGRSDNNTNRRRVYYYYYYYTARQTSDFFRELFALDVHVFHVHLAPRRSLPVVDARVDQVNVIPQLLKSNQITSIRPPTKGRASFGRENRYALSATLALFCTVWASWTPGRSLRRATRTLGFEPCYSRSLLSLSWRRSARNRDRHSCTYQPRVIRTETGPFINILLGIYLLKDFIFFERFSEIVYSAVKVWDPVSYVVHFDRL